MDWKRSLLRALGAFALAAPAALPGLAALTACDEKREVLPPPPMAGRSDALVATSTNNVSTGAPPATPTTAERPPATRKLCGGQDPRPAPKASPKTAAASGATPPSLPIGFGVGKWVWVNLWAAWCAPCKEEIPRLIAWREKLARGGVMLDLAFVSLDDDERQMRRFLESQPEGGLRATYYLPDGDERATWLRALGVKETQSLPVHALVAPSGLVSCVIQGAVEDGDFPSIRAFLTNVK
jgi:thiol-disulfide isomerase/thioredoxin